MREIRTKGARQRTRNCFVRSAELRFALVQLFYLGKSLKDGL